MNNNIFKRSIALLLVLVCIMGILPMSAFAAGVTPPASITQISSAYVTINGRYARYEAASSAINNVGLPYVFNEQVNIPGYGPGRALCAYQLGTLGSGANGQKWNFEQEVTNPSLVAILTYVYSFTNGTFTDSGKAVGLGTWNEPWANLWFMVAQAMSWLHEHGVIIDYTVDRAGFAKQLAEEFVAAYKMYHDVYGWSGWITDWRGLTINTIIDSADGGVTGKTALDIANEVLSVVIDNPQYFMKYRMWIYDWDKSQPWLISGQEGTPMQKLLVAVPIPPTTVVEDPKVSMTIKKLEAGTNQPLAGVSFQIEGINDGFSTTKTTGADGTISLTQDADGITAGQYRITEVAAPEGYVAQTGSQVVTVLPDNPAGSVFTFYNTKEDIPGPDPGDGSIRKIDADNPTVGLAGAVIKLTSVKLDDGGSFTSTYTTGDGGYISKEDLDFADLPTGSYVAEEITPPEGYILSSDVSKVKQAFTWDGEHDISLIFENSSKVKVQLKKVDESGNPLAGAIFVVLRDGKVIETKETDAAGTITVSNVSEGYYEFREVSAPAGFDCDKNPVGVHVNAEDLQGEQTITVEKVNHHKRSLTIQKRDTESGNPVANTSFHIRGVNLAYENDVVTGADGKVVLSEMASGCYEITETAVPSPYLLDTNNRKTVWIDATQDQDVVVNFVNSTRPGLRLVKTDYETGTPIEGVTFKVEQVDGGYSAQHRTDSNGLIVLDGLTPGAYVITEVAPAAGYVADPIPRTVLLEANKTTTVEIANIKLSTFRLIKTSADGSPLDGVTFRIARIEDGSHYLDRTTQNGGEIVIEGLEPGMYSVTETATLPDHILDTTEHHVELFPGKTSEIRLNNDKRPTLVISKTDKDTGKPVPGVTFTLRGADGPTITTKPTGADGKIVIENLLPGVYTITEQSVPENYILDTTPQTVTLFANREAQVEFQNYQRPTLKITKVDINGKHLTGAIFEVKTKAGVKIGDFPVGEDGTVTISNVHLEEGYYIITELQAPKGYILDKTPHEVYLRPGKTTEVSIENEKKPGLTIYKVDSVVGDGVKGAKFEIWVSKDKTENGTYQKLNDTFYYTDENGMIELPELDTGWYKVKEVEPPAGYMLKEPSEQILYIEHDKGSSITFENTPKSALVIRKIDSDTGAPLVNAWFRVRYLGGTSGSGGTIIGEYQTSANGNIVITGLDAGTYICEEISAPHGYVMDTAPQTAYISGKEQGCITLTFTNSKYGSLLIKKVDSVTKEPLSDVQFFINTSDGAVVGNANGYFTTDSAGTILVSDIKPGTTLVVKETRTIPGYILDDTPQTVKIVSNETMTLEFRNQPNGSLLVRKVCATNPSVTLQNAEFKIAYADGSLVGDSNGVFRTDEAGEIRVDGLTPGKSVVVTEVKAPAGFLIDTAPQTAVIQSGKTVTLTFKDQPKGKLIIQKRDSQTNQPLPGAEFRITTAAGCEVGLDGVIGSSTLTSNGIFTTNADGEIRISNLAPGAYILNEIKAPNGYVIDTPSTNVVIGQGGDTQTVVIKNTKKGGLIIEKYDSVTKQALPGARFKVTTASGELVADNEGLTSSNGLYTTNANGQIVLSKLLPGTYIVTEDKAPDNYRKDPTPQTVVVNAGDTQTVRFYDEPLCSLTILKRDSVTKKPLKGAEFTVTDSSGRVIGPSAGKYVTGADGTVTVTGMQPNSTVVVRESKAPKGYILDETPKNIVVRSGEANSITFDNEPGTTLIIRKFIEGTENEPLSGVAFKVVDGSGAAVGPDDGTYYTDKAGEIVLDGIEPGTTVKVREIKTVDGFVLDGTPQDILIKGGEVQQLTFWNKRAGTLLIEKLDSVTKAPLAGAQFKVVYADGRVVDTEGGKLSSNGIYLSDSNGQIKITGLVGTVVVTEEKAPDGYVMDVNAKSQTVVVNPNDTQTLRFYNDPLCSLTLTKRDSVTGKPVPGTEFTVKDGNGNILGRYTTGKDGTATVAGLIPGSTVVVTETKVPSGYVLNSTPQTITIKKGTGNAITSGGTGSTGENSGGSSGGDLVFENDPKTKLVIEKYITGTTTPIKGVTFLVTDSSGELLGNENGEFTTDENGRIVIEGLEPGVTVTAKEIRTLEGYILDSTPKSIKIKVGAAQTLKFYNQKQGCIVIRKLDSVTKKPLAGVEFQLTYADGSYVDADNGHLSSRGLYTTNKNGEIRVSGVTGTIIVTETKTIDGYTIDEATRTQSVKVNASDTQYLTFYNDPIGGLELIKVSEADKTVRIPDTTFEIRRASDGGLVKTVTTGKTGRVYVDLDAGSYHAVEIEAAKGYKLDSTPHYFAVRNGETCTLTVKNRPISGILIHKTDSLTGKALQGVSFLLYDYKNTPLGQYTSDNEGYVYIENLSESGRYYLKELDNPGYVPDTQLKTVYVKAGETTLIEWKNIPITAQVQITKKSADYNSINGLPAGTLLEGAVFEIRDKAGNLVDTIKSDKNGVAASKPLPLGRYTIRETKAPANYQVNSQELTAYLEHAGQIVRFEVADKSVTTGVAIQKTGPKEAMAGQPVNYTFSSIGNTSSVTLTSFYWRDILPAEVRLNTIVTGTYNFPGTYKITYRVNGGEYRTLADNLSTSKNYTLAASPAALGLAANQRVTEVMFVFGQVPAGFAQVEKPQIKCIALSNIAAASFVNVADVGGVYGGKWIQAVTRWVTIVYKKPIPLPKTGY